MGLASDIGRTLVLARRDCGLTQRELGESVGVKQQQVARWEATGYASASLARVDAVARALGLGSADLSVAAPLAAEAGVAYGSVAAPPAPARDLAEVVSRIREHGDELRDRFGVRRVGVYGSFLTGENTDASDVDLVVDLDAVSFDTEFGAAARLQEVLGRRVDLALPAELRPEIRDRVLREVLDVWEA